MQFLKCPIRDTKYKIRNTKYLLHGFTLIELLVVVAILGILATLGLANFRTSQIKSRDAQRKSDLKQIQNALELLYNDHSRYPAAVTSGSDVGKIRACNYIPLTPASSGICGWGSTVGMSDGNTVYLKTVHQDPSGFSYYYQTDTAGTKYRILARLENSQDPKCIISCTTGIVGTDCDPVGTATCNFGLASANHSPETAP